MSPVIDNEIILSPEVDNYIKKFIENERLQNVKIETDRATSKGNNFLSVVSRVAISGERDGKLSTTHFIVKLPVSDEDLQNKYSVSPFFVREIFVYNNVLKFYYELQEDNVPEEQKLILPKCYFTSDSKSKECLVLEDFKQKGYEVYDKFKSVDLDHCILVMEALGKLHAMSFVVQRRMKRQFETLIENSEDILKLQYGDNREESLKYMSMRVSEALAVLDDDEEKEKLKKFDEKMLDLIFEASQPGPYSAILHGDCWTNNALFKYLDGKPTEVCLIDYQLSRYASPVLDIHYFLWNSCDDILRRSHYEDIHNAYYDALSRHLMYHSLDSSEVFPYDMFKDHVKKYSVYGIGNAILNLPLMLRDESDLIDLADLLEEQDEIKLNTCEAYKIRMQGLVRDAINYGHLEI